MENDRIIIRRFALDQLNSLINHSGKVLIITDDGVPILYASKVASYFENSYVLTLPQGESSKSFRVLQTIVSYLVEQSFSREDCIIAVGGGMVGDVSGFAASCYMRGIAFYNIPTTLLAQVDSSVGGKTAINADGIKNIVGTFYPAQKVIIDPTVLDTLPDRQFASGLAEAVKMACTSSCGLFEYLRDVADIRQGIDRVISECIDIKTDIVKRDPKETGERKVLNFGHTVGHAIEAVSAGKLLHGECVAIGMKYFCSPSAWGRIKPVLEKFGLPVTADISPQLLTACIRHDKKSSSKGITAVFVNSIGTFELRTLSLEQISDLVYGK